MDLGYIYEKDELILALIKFGAHENFRDIGSFEQLV